MSMTAFITRCFRNLSLLYVFAALAYAFGAVDVARAEGIEVKRAALTLDDDSYQLQADFEIQLNPTLEDALNKGVSLYFLLEFEVIRPRWYWLNEKIISLQQQYRLSYNGLTRQYRLGTGSLYQNFPDLSAALNFLSRVRKRQVLEPRVLTRGAEYVASVRMRLDVSQLPRPFQLNALGSRDWNFGSEWFRWTLSP